MFGARLLSLNLSRPSWESRHPSLKAGASEGCGEVIKTPRVETRGMRALMARGPVYHVWFARKQRKWLLLGDIERMAKSAIREVAKGHESSCWSAKRW